MPYDSDSDQFYWGYSPSRDGSNYDPAKPSPKLSDAFRVLSRNFKNAKPDDLVQFAVVGKLYKGGTPISGVSKTITWGSLEATATSVGLTGKAVTKGGGGFSLEDKVAALLGLREKPEQITGIYFRVLD